MQLQSILSKYGAIGVAALQSVTPSESGATAAMWSYKVTNSDGKWKVEWHNQNRTSSGVPVVILLQYGHGTGTGGYVAGRDFINPVIKPIFAQIESEIRREVSRK